MTDSTLFLQTAPEILFDYLNALCPEWQSIDSSWLNYSVRGAKHFTMVFGKLHVLYLLFAMSYLVPISKYCFYADLKPVKYGSRLFWGVLYVTKYISTVAFSKSCFKALEKSSKPYFLVVILLMELRSLKEIDHRCNISFFLKMLYSCKIFYILLRGQNDCRQH